VRADREAVGAFAERGDELKAHLGNILRTEKKYMDNGLLYKHARYGFLRKHQVDIESVARKLIDGRHNNKLISANVTPGGGKTKMAAIFANELLDAGIVGQVLYLVPRDSLRSQVQQSFYSPTQGLAYRACSVRTKTLSQEQWVANRVVVATYQSVVAEPLRFLRYVKLRPTLVTFDEIHHLAARPNLDEDDDDGTGATDADWFQACEALFVFAKCVLAMSGGMVRGDGQRIPFIEYDDEKKPKCDVVYRRSMALIERAVIPVQFVRLDANAKWEHRNAEHEAELSATKAKARSLALRTALARSDYRDVAIQDFIEDWQHFRQHYYRSRAIVIADSIERAEHYALLIRSLSVDVTLATSKEGDKGQRALRRFRDNNGGDVLVTVGMAYEGLDVPDCTHEALFTRVRSFPYLDQSANRVTRFDRNSPLTWEEQRATIYVPDDQKMQQFIDHMTAEQDEAFKEVKHRAAGEVFRGRSTFRPLEAAKTATRFSEPGLNLSDEDNQRVATLHRIVPETKHWPLTRCIQLATAVDFEKLKVGT